jgi:hypothetical protein
LDWIDADVKNDGYCRACRKATRVPVIENDGHPTASQIGCQFGEASWIIACPAVFDRNVLTLNEAGFA